MAAKKKAKKKTARKVAKKNVRKAVKTPARKAAKKKKAPTRKAGKKKAAPARRKKTIGEGDYEASRAFLKDQAGFVQKNRAKIPAMGKAAKAALEGAEGPSLLAAEAEARSHGKGTPS